MNVRNRFGLVIATAAIGVVGALGLTACGPATAATTSMSPEATALTALGFSDTDVTGNADTTVSDGTADGGAASAAPNAKHRHPALRRLLVRHGLGKRVLHGEITISTKDGDKTIEVQRGTITAITDTTVTVKCADGFTLTWTFGSPIHVIEHRTTVQPTALHAGEIIGVAGLKNADTNVARLIVVPNAENATTGS